MVGASASAWGQAASTAPLVGSQAVSNAAKIGNTGRKPLRSDRSTLRSDFVEFEQDETALRSIRRSKDHYL